MKVAVNVADFEKPHNLYTVSKGRRSANSCLPCAVVDLYRTLNFAGCCCTVVRRSRSTDDVSQFISVDERSATSAGNRLISTASVNG